MADLFMVTSVFPADLNARLLPPTRIKQLLIAQWLAATGRRGRAADCSGSAHRCAI